ncbi:hypothetical protein M3Y95_00528300 [Aphelenchoides besseyi]|nr:hypothetical protein M3Y95_00528300 [Aphelenchoides besseyi]
MLSLRTTSRRQHVRWNHHPSLPEIYSERPYQLTNGMLKLFLGTIGSLYIGGKIAQHCANFLEENEIFVHEDDDDED